MSALLSCKQHVENALSEAAQHRDKNLAWIEREREVMAIAANEWALAHGYPPSITVDVVERVEGPAVGHIDYASKMALYVAEQVVAGGAS